MQGRGADHAAISVFPRLGIYLDAARDLSRVYVTLVEAVKRIQREAYSS